MANQRGKEIMKTVFIDQDGVLCSYADCNDKVCATEFPYGFFLDRYPVLPVINKIWELYKNDHLVILSAVPHLEAIVEKNIWLDRHFPVKDRYFIMWKTQKKCDFIKEYCIENNVDIKDCILIDDEHEILRECEKIGCQVWHISRLLTLKKESN